MNIQKISGTVEFFRCRAAPPSIEFRSDEMFHYKLVCKSILKCTRPNLPLKLHIFLLPKDLLKLLINFYFYGRAPIDF